MYGCAEIRKFMYKRGIRNSLFRVCCAICAVAMAPIGTGFRARAQTPSADLSFEVATVKPVLMDASHPFDPERFGPHVNPAGASYSTMTVGYLIGYAYGVDFPQVIGPKWTAADRFDIEARFPQGADNKDDHRMLQALLKEHFKLAFHIEKRELEGYALVVDKRGEKLRPSPPDPVRPETDVPFTSGDPNVGDGHAKSKTTEKIDGANAADRKIYGTQTVKFDQETSSMHFEQSKMTMGDLAQRLSICMDSSYHKVVDETGIKGNYQVAYDCPLPRPPLRVGSGDAGMLPPDPPDTYSLTRSLDALGLKLEKRKVLMDVYVIDHVEKPSEN